MNTISSLISWKIPALLGGFCLFLSSLFPLDLFLLFALCSFALDGFSKYLEVLCYMLC